MMKNLCLVASLVAVALTSSAAAAQDLLITNARIIDGTGRVIENGSVLVDDERIVSVTGGDAGVDAALVIDAGGMTVMPGMIDTHVHITGSPDIDRTALTFLELGFTTIADLGGNLEWLADVRDRIAAGAPGPRILSAVSIAGPGNHPVSTVCRFFQPAGGCEDIVEVGDPAQGRETVRRYDEEHGVDTIKVIYQDTPPGTMVTDDVLLAIAQEAEARGLPLTVHSPVAVEAIRAIDLGANRMAHAPVTPETEAIDLDALARSLIQASVPVSTTAHFIAPVTNDSGDLISFFGDQPFTDENFRILDEHMSRLRTLWDAGVTIAFGTDAFMPEPTSDLRSEIETLARVFSPEEVLTALTRNAAAYLGLDAEIGTLEAGKIADIVIVDGDPLASVDNLRNVAVVIRAGNVVVDNR
jgi:imidazolonepropionase-like amidohydrolase